MDIFHGTIIYTKKNIPSGLSLYMDGDYIKLYRDGKCIEKPCSYIFVDCEKKLVFQSVKGCFSLNPLPDNSDLCKTDTCTNVPVEVPVGTSVGFFTTEISYGLNQTVTALSKDKIFFSNMPTTEPFLVNIEVQYSGQIGGPGGVTGICGGTEVESFILYQSNTKYYLFRNTGLENIETYIIPQGTQITYIGVPTYVPFFETKKSIKFVDSNNLFVVQGTSGPNNSQDLKSLIQYSDWGTYLEDIQLPPPVPGNSIFYGQLWLKINDCTWEPVLLESVVCTNVSDNTSNTKINIRTPCEKEYCLQPGVVIYNIANL